MNTADIVIAGAGVIGLSIAVQLARRTSARIVVLERAKTLGVGSTGASSSICRHKYTLPEAMMLARDGIHAYRNWQAFLEIPKPLAQYTQVGALWLGDGNGDWPEREARRMAQHGIRAEVLSDLDLAERFPAINPCLESFRAESADDHSCHGGGSHLFEPDGGYLDPVDVLHDLLGSATAKGVEVRFGAEAAAVDLSHGRISAVRLADGSSIACPTLVSAVGPWCLRLFEGVGLQSPWRIEPTRIQVVHIDRPPEVQGALPITLDPTGGIYFRTQNRGQQILVGSLRDEDERELVIDPDGFATYADDGFMRTILFMLEHRLRGLERMGRPRGYSGLYTFNRQDYHPIVGPTPVEGLYVANGMSGHGFKLAPAIGSLVAQMLAGRVTDFDTAVGPDFLAFDRKPLTSKVLGVLA